MVSPLRRRPRPACIACLCASLAATVAFGADAPPAPAPAAAVPPAPAAKAWPVDDAGLRALAVSLVEDWTARTTEPALEAVMLPCFQMVSYRGSSDRAGAAKQLAALGAAGPKASEVIATRVGDALVVTCMLRIVEKDGGRALPQEASPRIGVWQQDGGAWKLAAWGSLNMPAQRPAPGAPGFAGDAALDAEGAAMVSRFLGTQHARKLEAFGRMLAEGMQLVNFKGQKVRKDLVRGAEAATIDEPRISDARATRCGELTIVTCTLAMGQRIGFTSLPADPAPFMAVFRGTGDGAAVIAMANTNKPK